MHCGNWQLDMVNGGKFYLDGGVMFGLVPRTLWKQVATPDARNRIQCANNCVLVRDGRHTVLIDTGYGGKFGPLDRKFYEMEEGEPLLAGLAGWEWRARGHRHGRVQSFALRPRVRSHLARCRPPPRAAVPARKTLVGRVEWEDATSGSPELATAYPMEDILPLYEAGLMMVVEDG